MPTLTICRFDSRTEPSAPCAGSNGSGQGTSALFLLVPTPVTDGVRQTLGAAELIQTAFSPEEAATAVRRAFAELPA